MPDELRPCCHTSYDEIEPWFCPATPIWARTVADAGLEAINEYALKNLPIHVINDPNWRLTIDPQTGSWEMSRA